MCEKNQYVKETLQNLEDNSAKLKALEILLTLTIPVYRGDNLRVDNGQFRILT